MTKTPKTLGLWMCTALVVGNMIGTGIFLLPATLAPFGWNALIGWVITIMGGLCLAIVFATLARNFPKAGGPYAYTREAFGEVPAFMVAWSYWIAMWVGNAAIATGAVSYLSVFYPALTDVTGLHAVVTLSAIWLLTFINCRGTFLAGSVQLVTAILKVLPLIAVIAIGLWVVGKPGPAVVTPFEFENVDLAMITAASTLTLWSLLGLESATVPAQSVTNPEKTIPRATLLGMGIAGIIYLVVFGLVLLLLPSGELAGSNAPFADFVSRFTGTGAGKLIALFAAISGFGALNGWILLQGELPNAMARNGVFPKWLAKRSERNTPERALIVAALLLTVVVLLNYQKSMTELFTFIVLLSTASSLFMFLACAMAAVKLKIGGGLLAGRTLMVFAILAVVYSVYAIYGAGGEAILWGVVLLIAGLPIYALTKRYDRRIDVTGL